MRRGEEERESQSLYLISFLILISFCFCPHIYIYIHYKKRWTKKAKAAKCKPSLSLCTHTFNQCVCVCEDILRSINYIGVYEFSMWVEIKERWRIYIYGKIWLQISSQRFFNCQIILILTTITIIVIFKWHVYTFN